jgi:hypothetical protein
MDEEQDNEPKKIGFKDLTTPLKFAFTGGMIYITIWICTVTIILGVLAGFVILHIKELLQ